MAVVTESTCVQQIGEVAGVVWHTLNDHGPMSVAKLIKHLETPRDLTMQAVGWLAREDKVEITETSRGRVISLIEDA